VAQAFDLFGVTTTVGAPSFAHPAKGGNHERVRCWVYVEQSVVSAASYPPLQKTQGRGTLSRDGANRNPAGAPTLCLRRAGSGRGERTAEGAVAGQENLVRPAAGMPTLRKPRSVGQPISQWCRGSKSRPAPWLPYNFARYNLRP
jgi:hypothetical protein